MTRKEFGLSRFPLDDGDDWQPHWIASFMEQQADHMTIDGACRELIEMGFDAREIKRGFQEFIES